jgi:PDZ domain
VRPSLGFALDTATDEIAIVRPGSIAERSGLQVGDQLLELDGVQPMAFLAGEWWPRDDRPILVKLRRAGKQHWCALYFDEEPAEARPTEAAAGADPFRGLFGTPAPERLSMGAETALDGVAENCQLPPGSPMLPARRNVDRSHDEIFAERERRRNDREPPPLMGGVRLRWID